MAFPIPAHLPRKSLPPDVSSQILTKISDTTSKSLTANLAAEWVSELQLSIQQTKDRIHDRIHEELPDFERQLESSKSVQTRLGNLRSNVDGLTDALENAETGILPTLLASLRAHSELAQRASDARVTHDALLYLGDCRTQFERLRELVGNGELPGGVKLADGLVRMLEEAPEALARADVMSDMKNNFRALKDRIEEQISEAYSRSVQISSTELRISPSVQVRQSQAIISLQDILSSFSSDSLSPLLASLRRDIIAHFIDFPLQQAVSANISRALDGNGAPSICLSIFPLAPSASFRNSSPAYLKTLFDFLRENLFSTLPPPISASFPQSLYKPTTTALLRDTLIPSLPSSLSGIPQFLSLAQEAVTFEQEYLSERHSEDDGLHNEGEVKLWTRGVAGHYGRKRRVNLLAEVRTLILSGGEDNLIRVEVSQSPEDDIVLRVPEVIPVQGEIDSADEPENSWDFEDEVPNSAPTNGKSSSGKTEVEENGWDFEDADANPSQVEQNQDVDEVQDDPDAWGWGDGGEENGASADEHSSELASKPTNGHNLEESFNTDDSEDSAWDSAWDEPEPVPPSPPSPVQPIAPAKVPRVAKRLEKLSAKGKEKGIASPSLSSNPPSSTFPSSPAFPSSASSVSSALRSPLSESSFPSYASSPQSVHPPKPPTLNSKPPALSLPQKPKEPETNLISGRVQDLVRLVSDVLSEGGAIAASSIFSDFPLSAHDSISSASTLVLQAAPAALDLYRAVYPVARASELTHSARALRFSNDCTYVHDEALKLKLPKGATDAVHEQMREALDRLHALGAWWFDEGIERECEQVQRILARAEGFVDTGDQEQFDECEGVMSEVLRDVRSATFAWKTVLPRTKWLRATGRVVESALARVLADVLALPDIPELDSRRLSELCRILSALEGMFVDEDNADAPSMVLAYVPSWLKYSYLSELLEASIADISYLFDEGALIDFSVDELVRLVRALFADTPLRANTIAKLQRGHPVAAG